MSTSGRFLLAVAALTAVVLLLPGSGSGPARAGDPLPAMNVILLIGDGMGVSSMTAARIWKYGPSGRLAMDSMPARGLVHTYSANRIVTDSAAAATAWATGQKTNNGMLSVDPAGSALETILERARASGKATGLVSTTRITHATPAAMNAHHVNRDAEADIAVQLLDGEVDVLLAGGLRYFIPADQAGCTTARQDGLDLVARAKAEGYTFVDERGELLSTRADRVLGLFHCDHLNYDLQRDRLREPSLAEMTAKAIELLADDPDGFFLQVEGGRIDHAAHVADGLNTMGDMIAFDEAVREALRFARSFSGLRTLVIVTADHETGGLAIGYDELGGALYHPDATGPAGDGGFPVPGHPGELTLGWATFEHSGQDVAIMAQGPHSEALNRVLDNTEVYDAMLEAMALE